MRKSLLVVVAILLTLTMVLSGCGGSNNSSENQNDSTNTADPQEPITLKFWGGVPAESGPQDAVDSWNGANPDIQVEYTRYVNDDSGNLKLETALLSSSDAPDIFISYADERITKRVQSDMAAPLNELITDSGFDLDGVIGEANMREFSDGKYYYIPAVINIGATLINKDALDEIDEPVPTDWTWDEYADLAVKLTKGDRKGAMQDPQLSNYPWQVLTTDKPIDAFIKEDGTSNFDSPAMRKGLELQKSLEEAGAMVKYSEAVVNKLTYQNELLTEKAAMLTSSLYLIRYIKDLENYPHDFKVAFAPIPQYKKGGNVNFHGGLGDYMSINNNSQHKEEAFKFMEWYLTEGNLSMVPGGRIPSNKHADQAKIAKQLVGDAEDLIDIDSLQNVLSGSYKFPTSYNVPVHSELLTILKEEMEKHFLDAQSLDETIEVMKTRADEAIENAK